MWYEYRCDTCGKTHETQTFRRIGEYLCMCPDCPGGYVRIVSLPQVTPPAGEPYFNHSIGQVVTSTRDFEEKLRIGGEKYTEETGLETRYTPVYPDEGRKMVEKINGPNVDLSA